MLGRTAKGALVTYVDGDLAFWSGLGPLARDLGDGSVLLVPHRYSSGWRHVEADRGVYNAGSIAFRNDEPATEALAWWSDRCLEWCFDRVEPGRFADQKYLDELHARFAGIRVAERPEAGLAPWNVEAAQLTRSGTHVLVDGRPLIFFHHHGLQLLRGVRLLRRLGFMKESYRLTKGPEELVWRTWFSAHTRATRADLGAVPSARLGRGGRAARGRRRRARWLPARWPASGRARCAYRAGSGRAPGRLAPSCPDRRRAAGLPVGSASALGGQHGALGAACHDADAGKPCCERPLEVREFVACAACDEQSVRKCGEAAARWSGEIPVRPWSSATTASARRRSVAASCQWPSIPRRRGRVDEVDHERQRRGAAAHEPVETVGHPGAAAGPGSLPAALLGRTRQPGRARVDLHHTPGSRLLEQGPRVVRTYGRGVGRDVGRRRQAECLHLAPESGENVKLGPRPAT